MHKCLKCREKAVERKKKDTGRGSDSDSGCGGVGEEDRAAAKGCKIIKMANIEKAKRAEKKIQKL